MFGILHKSQDLDEGNVAAYYGKRLEGYTTIKLMTGQLNVYTLNERQEVLKDLIARKLQPQEFSSFKDWIDLKNSHHRLTILRIIWECRDELDEMVSLTSFKNTEEELIAALCCNGGLENFIYRHTVSMLYSNTRPGAMDEHGLALHAALPVSVGPYTLLALLRVYLGEILYDKLVNREREHITGCSIKHQDHLYTVNPRYWLDAAERRCDVEEQNTRAALYGGHVNTNVSQLSEFLYPSAHVTHTFDSPLGAPNPSISMAYPAYVCYFVHHLDADTFNLTGDRQNTEQLFKILKTLYLETVGVGPRVFKLLAAAAVSKYDTASTVFALQNILCMLGCGAIAFSPSGTLYLSTNVNPLTCGNKKVPRDRFNQINEHSSLLALGLFKKVVLNNGKKVGVRIVVEQEFFDQLEVNTDAPMCYNCTSSFI
ncbi:glucocorticoid receptor-like domain protein [Ranid herpesvirus 3]|uniref:Glucocorticoid receptor-like domain protein n=1 Tax=Ranid herpesvirus 3 TaxID=1987509 RepID=A0A1X9T570_9VIRU|nr:glucocorticoid receptor-like domain protein [Ranid herpesvirus 3]ARR28846.1 glucocorticoid receptor-like domain protein [Ranid herpesvirus 3]